MADKDRQEAIDALLRRGAQLPDESESFDAGLQTTPAEQNPEPKSSRYELHELLGSGSMGQVHRAYDRRLHRTVAVKLLKSEDPALLQQFLREARIQARVEHEHICKVYDTGTMESGRPFIAMQYVAGEPLRSAAQRMSLEQKILLMKEVAEAVHAAHQAGLIHRDLKPGNILVEPREDGGWKPCVLDFGLARDQEAPGITTTGMLLGTPAYMSPEQARGDVRNLDRRTDVYSLGASLYELLAGKPPLTGATRIEVLTRILQEDPPALRKIQPSTPQDVETIVMKCLQKEPSRRYDSARALAEDLSRYLAGEPILARPADWKYLLLKKAKKHKAAVAIAAIALVSILILGTLWFRERWMAAEHARAAQVFGQEVERLNGFLRFSYTLPLHDLTREKALVRQKMTWIESQMRSAAAFEDAGHFALGSAHLALHEYREARSHLEAAWNHGYRSPEVAYALGQTLGALYQKGLSEDPDNKADLVRQYRDPALAYLKTSRNIPGESPEYVEGLIALYEGKYETALLKARTAFQQTPGFYEGKKLEADVYLTSGTERRWNGEFDLALKDLEKAGEAYRSALEIGRSDPSLLLGLCGQSLRQMEAVLLLHQQLPDFQPVLAACDRVLQADPENAAAYYKKSEIYHRVGEYRMNHGEQFLPLFRNAITMGEQAMRLDPGNASYFETMGLAYWRMGTYEADHGLDASRSLSQAVTVSEKAARMNPKQPEPYGLAGLAWYTRGEVLLDSGQDPRRALTSALESFRAADRVSPGWEPALNGINFSLTALAEWTSWTGGDPQPLLREAVAAGERAVRLYPNLAMSKYFLSGTFQKMAEHGIDSTASWARALELCDKSLELSPSNASAHTRLGEIRLYTATPAEAAGAFRKAIELNPQSARPYRGLARAALASGNAAGARAAIATAQELNPGHYETDLIRGLIDLREAKMLQKQQKDASAALRSAESALRESLRRNPKYPETLQALRDLAQTRSSN